MPTYTYTLNGIIPRQRLLSQSAGSDWLKELPEFDAGAGDPTWPAAAVSLGAETLLDLAINIIPTKFKHNHSLCLALPLSLSQLALIYIIDSFT